MAVLQAEFGPTCKILTLCLTSYETSNSTSLLKSVSPDYIVLDCFRSIVYCFRSIVLYLFLVNSLF